MGYYTTYNLSWDKNKAPKDFDISRVIEVIVGDELNNIKDKGPHKIDDVNQFGPRLYLTINPNPDGYSYAIRGRDEADMASATRDSLLEMASFIQKKLAYNDNEKRKTDTFRMWLNILCGDDSTKWYDYEIDMVRVSKKYPDILFTLDRKGEESGDLTKEYFLGGKHESVQASISYKETSFK